MTPPLARVLILKNERRSSCFIFIGAPLLCSGIAGGDVNGFTDSKIGTATADVARHGRVDLSIRGFGCFREEGGCRHQLARLAITALGYVDLNPCLLQRM